MYIKNMKGFLKGCDVSLIAFGLFLLIILIAILYNNRREGMEDMEDKRINMDDYVLKTNIVPPVCPACPDVKLASREKPCPPCPACERCPESSFECKKIPTYSNNNSYIPVPVLNDFSGFGM